MKSSLPNIFSCTVFKKHVSLLLDQNENKVKSSRIFFFLPSTLDRKEEFIQWREQVHLHPIDLNIDNLMEISGLTDINPALLESNHREKILPGYYKIMKKIAEISNQNLIRTFLAEEKLILIMNSCGQMIHLKRIPTNFN